MNDSKANVALIKHVTKCLNEFLDENSPGRFQTIEEMQRNFARWLRQKETGGNKIKHGDGMIAEEVFAEDFINEHSATLGFIKIVEGGHVGVMWSPLLFMVGTMMPDELREELVGLLRFHADKLEDRSLDTRMRECAGKVTGAA